MILDDEEIEILVDMAVDFSLGIAGLREGLAKYPEMIDELADTCFHYYARNRSSSGEDSVKTQDLFVNRERLKSKIVERANA